MSPTAKFLNRPSALRAQSALKKKRVEFSEADLGEFIIEHEGCTKLDTNVKRSSQATKKSPAEKQSEQSVAVIIEVSKKGYVPSGAQVRAVISPVMFTAEIPQKKLRQLSDDPLVVSVGTPKRILPVK